MQAAAVNPDASSEGDDDSSSSEDMLVDMSSLFINELHYDNAGAPPPLAVCYPTSLAQCHLQSPRLVARLALAVEV